MTPLTGFEGSEQGHETSRHRLGRRRFLTYSGLGIAAVAVAGVSAVELIAHGVLPGQQVLDQIEGKCSVASPQLDFSSLGPSRSGAFFSHARNRSVGYTLAYPPDHDVGSRLSLVVMLHGFGGNHATALAGMTPAQAVALRMSGKPLAPLALVTVDGGGGYWNPHPGDDPMAMVIHELIPRCQRLGLGRSPNRIGTMGISMGGYGAILFAEKYPRLIAAVAAISPAIWTSYDQANGANSGAYASREDFAADDAVTHTKALASIPVRIASGYSDPFRPGVESLAKALSPTALVNFSRGCHTSPFFVAEEPPSLNFLAQHLN